VPTKWLMASPTSHDEIVVRTSSFPLDGERISAVEFFYAGPPPPSPLYSFPLSCGECSFNWKLAEKTGDRVARDRRDRCFQRPLRRAASKGPRRPHRGKKIIAWLLARKGPRGIADRQGCWCRLTIRRFLYKTVFRCPRYINTAINTRLGIRLGPGDPERAHGCKFRLRDT